MFFLRLSNLKCLIFLRGLCILIFFPIDSSNASSSAEKRDTCYVQTDSIDSLSLSMVQGELVDTVGLYDGDHLVNVNSEIGVKTGICINSDIAEHYDTQFSQQSSLTDLKVYMNDDSLKLVPGPKKNIWMAAGTGVLINTSVWAVDKWILKRDYSSKGWSTIKDNWEKGFVWDTDGFYTNFFAHPYHGALYYNAAKGYGCNFLESSLLTFLGSMEWEMIAESDYPSPNDVFSTTFGGMAVGEVTHRISNLILNNKRRGFNRVMRELLFTAVNPAGGLVRLSKGDMWKVDDSVFLYHDKSEIPFDCFLSVGGRWYDSRIGQSHLNAFVALDAKYGDLCGTVHNKPYDFFRAQFVFNIPSGEVPLLSKCLINGRLFGWNLRDTDNYASTLSINQDFSFYSSDKSNRFKGDKRHLLNLSDAAALGPAFSLEAPHFSHTVTTNLVMMGGYTSDYYYRGYNMGSGFNLKTWNELNVLSDRLKIRLDASMHYLFTWKGYEEDQKRILESRGKPVDFNPFVGRKAGEKSYAVFLIFNPRIDMKLCENLFFTAELDWVFRNSVYKYQNNVKARYSDFRLSLSYRLQ